MTVRLWHGSADLVRIRFAISPVWETNAAVRLLTRGRTGSPHGRWLRDARRRADGLDLRGLVALMPPKGYTPDFLTPPPAGPGTTFVEELARVRSTPLAEVRREIDLSLGPNPSLPPGAGWLAGDPGVALGRLADALSAAWQTLVQPGWSLVRDVLEADIAFHSRRSSREGVAALFRGLDDRVFWDDGDGLLRVENGVAADRDLGGEGLVLMPSSFVWPDVVAVTDPPWQATLVYPARGVAGLWVAAGVDPGPALVRLVGARRAAVLRMLGAPTTTSRLARSLSLSPGTVSEHLTVLREAGLVTRRRTGRTVEYQRTPLGDSLLSGQPGAR